jgi:hypothetical protein
MLNNPKTPKLLNEFSVDELLQMFNSSNTEEQQEFKELNEEDKIQNVVIKFLIFYDIKPGIYKINGKTLYKLFRSWNRGNDPISYDLFVKQMNGQFKTKNQMLYGKNNPYFSVSTSLAKITKHIEEKSKKIVRFKKSKNYLRYMEEFLNRHNIKPGNIYVESDVLYYMFDSYQHNKKRKMMNYFNFISLCNLFFETRELGLGTTWFGVSEEIKNLITPEWLTVWRQGRVKYGYIQKKTRQEVKTKIHTTKWTTEEVQKRKMLYPETLPKNESKEQDKVSSTESSVQSEKQD